MHAAVRATSPRQAYSILLWGLHLCWVGMCLTLLANPGRVRWLFEKRVQASKLVPVAFMLLVLWARPLCTRRWRAVRSGRAHGDDVDKKQRGPVLKLF